jgi:hypothetical protein
VTAPVLRFRSPRVELDYSGRERPTKAVFEGWKLKEHYARKVTPASKFDPRYHLTIERTLTISDDIGHLHPEGVHMIERIERVWGIAAGVPLGRHVFAVGLATIDTPRGWSDNRRFADVALTRLQGGGLIIGSIRFQRGGYSAPWWPLPRVLRALEKLKLASDIERELVELHYAAHSARGASAVTTLLFAKGLDIVRALLPGTNDAARERALPPDVKAALGQPFHRLFEQSNRRRETRHPVVHHPTPALQPAMSGAELMGYLRDADTVIRGVLCSRWGLDHVDIRY